MLGQGTDMFKYTDMINSQNGGRGFGVKGGNAADTYFYKLNYTQHTYGPSAAARWNASFWEEDNFPGFHVIVGIY